MGFIVRHWPGMLGFLIRYLAYKIMFGRIESMPYIQPGVRFLHMKNIYLGKGVLINTNCYIYGRGGVEIGDKTLLSPNCVIVAGDHDISLNEAIIDQPCILKKIIIGKDCWVGANSVVLGGVKIADGSIIGAGSVVSKDTEKNSINVGAPLKMIGMRKNQPFEGKLSLRY